MRFSLFVVCLALLGDPVWAGEDCTEDAMIVFDGSGSMAETGFNAIGAPRIGEARQAVRSVMPELAARRRLGLVVYGPHGDRACQSAALRLEPQWEAGGPIIAEVDGLVPDGETPLTEGVRLAAETLQYREKPGVVVLVTDGKETCGGDPCALAGQFAREAPGLVVHVIGFKVRGEHWDWSNPGAEGVSVARCLAEETGGQYVNAESVADLEGALRMTLGCAVLGGLPALTHLR